MELVDVVCYFSTINNLVKVEGNLEGAYGVGGHEDEPKKKKMKMKMKMKINLRDWLLVSISGAACSVGGAGWWTGQDQDQFGKSELVAGCHGQAGPGYKIDFAKKVNESWLADLDWANPGYSRSKIDISNIYFANKVDEIDFANEANESEISEVENSKLRLTGCRRAGVWGRLDLARLVLTVPDQDWFCAGQQLAGLVWSRQKSILVAKLISIPKWWSKINFANKVNEVKGSREAVLKVEWEVVKMEHADRYGD
ncbi:hypothetical protein BY996DRAFT_6621181 [Phakopsora pachyrhizi]|nr:hypothetical protein BY996DRAFT_6621181 [Phakopsora pachyrhizi]